MGKPTICIGENKDADQLRGNREADQRLCFRYSDNTIPLLLKSEIRFVLDLFGNHIVGSPTRRLIWANQQLRPKQEYPEKKHLTYLQANVSVSDMCPNAQLEPTAMR